MKKKNKFLLIKIAKSNKLKNYYENI